MRIQRRKVRLSSGIYQSQMADLNFSSGTQPRSILQIGHCSISSSVILSQMHFLQTKQSYTVSEIPVGQLIHYEV